MSYRFLSPALTELTEAAEFYEKSIPGLGADFIDEVDIVSIFHLNRDQLSWKRNL